MSAPERPFNTGVPLHMPPPVIGREPEHEARVVQLALSPDKGERSRT
ncbi:MAG: hypothetical protein JOY79_10030, partial [Acidobacteriaceae bacterium]|nr:hypothetical protein [Acidobacteriaceae bacterium]